MRFIISLQLAIAVLFLIPESQLTAQSAASIREGGIRDFATDQKQRSNANKYWKDSVTAKTTIRVASQELESLDALADDQSSPSDLVFEDVIEQIGAPALSDWPKKALMNIRVNPFLANSKKPADTSQRLLSKYSGNWDTPAHGEKSLIWEAPNIRYKPLMFEDVALERYGHVVRDDYFQSVVSAVHFLSSAALFPLHAAHDPVWSCDYPLGYCRPGNCTQRIFQRQFWGRRR